MQQDTGIAFMSRLSLENLILSSLAVVSAYSFMAASGTVARNARTDAANRSPTADIGCRKSSETKSAIDRMSANFVLLAGKC